MQTTDTIGRVTRPRGVLSEETVADLEQAKSLMESRRRNYREAVVAALEEGSFSEVSRVTGLSKDTLQRWKREASR